MIKLDYVTPGSDLGTGDRKPEDSSPAVAMYRQAIKNNAADIRLDISWRLDMHDASWNVWRDNADSVRVDRDINFDSVPVAWGPIQRTVEQYRQFINREVLRESNSGQLIRVRPDMDNLMVGNKGSDKGLSALTDTQRYSQAILWIGAGANLITGSDLKHLDHIGEMLLSHQEVLDVASFTSNWPMVPRNPSDAVQPGQPGGTGPYQLQTWIAGPNPEGTAVVILSNLSEDQCTDGECSYGTEWHDIHLVNITLADLGIGGDRWFVRRVLGSGPGGQGGSDFTDIGPVSDFLASNLNHYESVMYKLQKCGTAGSRCQ
jgi:alpha-galactosidase